MNGLLALVGVVLIPALSWPGHAIGRDQKQRAAFVKAHPCPATGKARVPCPGYVVDHIRPLCAGGADHARNMQWQTIAAAKEKDRLEHAECRRLRTLTSPER
jgi:hypothetical protein